MHHETKGSHLKMNQKRHPETNISVDVSQNQNKNETKKRPETNMTGDVTQKQNDARDRREERAHFALQNKGFALENEAKKRP